MNPVLAGPVLAGLATVREIVEAHGWSVAAVDGEGARFEVTGVEAVDH